MARCRKHAVALIGDSPLDVGGVETHLLTLLRRGRQSGYEWLVVSPTTPAFSARATALGARVVAWQPAHALDLAALVRLVRLLREYRVALVHVHSPRAAVFGRIAAGLLRLPVVVTVHMPSYRYQSKGLFGRCKPHLYREAERILNHRLTDRLIYVAQSVFEEALALGLVPRERATVIENGIDLGRYDKGEEAAGHEPISPRAERERRICYLGRLERLKGVNVLLDAVSLLEPDRHSWRLRLAGDGPERNALEEQAARLGLGPSVEFLGLRADAPAVLRESDIFVLPSHHEAMSMALLEAMAAGLPAVVTDVGDNARLVEDGITGLVVPAGKPAALAAALGELLVDPARCRRMAREARSKATLYSDRRMVQRTLEVYASLLDSRPGRCREGCRQTRRASP